MKWSGLRIDKQAFPHNPSSLNQANPNRTVLSLLKDQMAKNKFLPFAMCQLPRMRETSHVPDLDALVMHMVYRSL